MRSNGLLLFAGLLAALLYHHYFVKRAYVEVEVNVSKRTYLKVYWASADGLFSRTARTRVTVDPAQENYGFFLQDIGRFPVLRFDPCQYEGEVTVKSIRITQRGYAPFEINDEKGFALLKPVNDVGRVTIDERGMTIETTGIDSQFVLALPDLWVGGGGLQTACELFALLFLFFAAGAVLRRYGPDFRYAGLLYSVVLSLVMVMALLSTEKVHPDEYVHIAAASYYMNNWLPPSVEDPAIVETYSIYGSSRLNTPEIYYLLAGKFQVLLSAFHVQPYLGFRLFNVLLFFLLSLLVLHRKDFRPLALALLVTPQIWYLFSYCNSDALALFVCIIIAYQLARPHSLFTRYVTGEDDRVNWKAAIALGLLMGLLLLSKKNYYFFLLYAGGFAVWRQWGRQNISWRVFFSRVLVIVLVGVSLFGLRKALDYSVNGLDRGEKIRQMRIKTALPFYNPATPLEERHPYLSMRDRGIPFKQIITKERWFEKSFRSAFGVYSYFTQAASPVYYDMARYAGLGMLLFLSVSVLMARDPRLLVLLFWTCFCAVFLISVSLYHSWVSDFQSQGRYLLGIVVMFGMLFCQLLPRVNTRLFTLCYAALFFVALYSFTCVGIYHIPKVVPL